MKSLIVNRVFLAACLIVAISIGWQDGQGGTLDPLAGSNVGDKSKIIKISGQVGAMSEFYSVSGRESRRPGRTGRLFLKPTISIYNTININLNLFLSTEGNGSRQDINQIDLNPQWGWGEAHLVDFTDNYSQYTLNGIKIRGAGLNLNPGLLRFSIISGTGKKEISTSGTKTSYRRQFYGGRIGIGREGGSYLDLILLSAKDKFSPADSIVIDTASVSDSATVDSTRNPASVTPQENIVAAVASNLSLKRFTWKNEFAGSAFTRDRRSPEWEQKNYPNYLRRYFVPRLSTSVDYAYSSEMGLNVSQYNFQAGYQYIGPGYVSLGLASQSSDRQTIKLGINRRLRAGAVKINYSRQNDNLIGQKSFTTDRNTVNLGVVYKPLAIWNINSNLTFAGMKNNAPDSSSQVDFTSNTVHLGNSFVFDREIGLRGFSLDYSYQTSGDSNPARANTSLRTHTIMIRGSYFPIAATGINPSVNYVDTRQNGGWSLTQTYTIGVNIAALDKKLMNNVQTSFTVNGKTNSAKFGLRSNYKLTKSAAINGQFDLNRVSATKEGHSFTESTARFSVTQRF